MALAVLAGACEAPSPSLPSPSALPHAAATPTRVPLVAVEVVAIGPLGTGVSVRVCAARISGGETCTRTGADGRGELALVPTVYSVRAGPDPERRLGESVVAADLTTARSVVVVLEGRAVIGGTVRDDHGEPVGGAEVCAHAATGTELRCARGGTDGAYRIEVRPGIHKLEVLPPPTGLRLIPQWARGRVNSFEADLIDTRSADVGDVDVVLVHGVVVSGHVTAQSSGAAVKDAQVCTLTFVAPLPWDCELTDERGRYAALREPGTYWVWIIPPPERGLRLIPQRYDRALTGFQASPFDLREDRTLDVTLTEGSVLTGVVRSEGGRPLVLAHVCLDTPFPTGRICRPTGDDGSYEIAVRPETYVVNVIPPDRSDAVGGYWEGSKRDWIEADELRIGSADRRLDIVLPLGVRFSGTIRDEQGVPVEGATVNLNDAVGPRFAVSTDIHGRYSIAVLPGRYTVDVFAPRTRVLIGVVGQPVTIEGETSYDAVMYEARP